jgi:hypothetical protein
MIMMMIMIIHGPRRFQTFRNKKNVYGEGFSAPRPAPKLEDHPLSAVRVCLFNIFADTLRIWRPSVPQQPEDAPCCGDKGPSLHGIIIIIIIINSFS